MQTLHNYRWFCCNAVFCIDGKVCQACLGSAAPWRGVVKRCYRGSRVASAAVAAMIGTHKALGTWRNAIDTYIALSEASRAKLIEGGLDARRIVVKPNFIYPDPGEGPGGGGYCLFVGRFSAEKGLLTLLRAWRHPGLQLPLKIIGAGPMDLEVQAAAAGNPNIQLLGQHTPKFVYDVLGRADLLIVHPNASRRSDASLPKPSPRARPFSRRISVGWARSSRMTRMAFFSSRATRTISPARRELLLSNPVKLQQMRKRARATFELNYTAETNHARLMSIYDRTLGRDALAMT